MDNEENIQFNWPILGHKNISKYLQRLIEKKNFIHTYLFTGPKDIGKKTVSNFFVSSILCQNDATKPCKTCVDCMELLRNIHPDYIYINLEEDKKNISIEQVRLFQEKMRLSPMRAKYKVGVINQADKLSVDASNALLKLIEEPPKNSIVILIAEKLENILPTIKSRSQKIVFNGVSNREIYEYLKNLGASSDLAQELADFSGGAPGLAMNYYKDLNSWKKEKESLNRMLEVMDNSINERFSFIDEKMKLASASDNAYIYFEELLGNYIKLARDLILFQISRDIDLIHPFLRDSISKISRKYSAETLLKFYKGSLEGKSLISKNVNPKIILENLIIDL